uniref:Putative salivary secreted protein n=1 Tax=Ixodes ricinus TaxID=34613 RepID=A0A6B0U8S7_IXORI
MLLILFATVLIVAETINGEKWPNYSNNTCIALIKEGGEIACNLTGQGESWDGYLKFFGNLPPYEFEYCDEDDEKRLRRWVDDWINYKEKARKTLCPRRRY